jgi:hypothetical protein
MQSEVREGLNCELTARVATAPKARFYPTGEPVWEFNCRVFMTAHTETLTVRCPDRNYGTLQNWAVPGRLVYMRGYLQVVRWKGQDGQNKIRLVIEPVELMPLGLNIQGSAPAAMDYAGVPRMSQAQAIGLPTPGADTAVAASKDRRAQLARELLEEASNPQ